MSRVGELSRTEDVRRPRITTSALRYRITVFAGADKGRTLDFDEATPGRLHVGTSAASSLVLSDRQVSRRHLALEPTGDGRVRLVDLGSTNGTFVSGIGIVDAYLVGGESVRVGATELRLEVLEGGEAPSLWPVDRFGRILGASPAMRRLYPVCQKLAAASFPVLVEGEIGTGKELMAESLHEMGPRAHAPFVVFDATALGHGDGEAALFGEENPRDRKGERIVRRGALEEANGGTLLVDDVGELSLVAQARLLRTIERSALCRVHGDEWIPVDVRIIATTRMDLEKEVERERFREDLYYRLTVGRLELPPLRERSGDVPLLARHFWSQLGRPGGTMPPELLASHEGYRWPGNVRELHNVIARGAALGSDWVVTESVSESSAPDLGPLFARIAAMELSLPEARAMVMHELERFYVARMLAKFGGNVTRAAAASGIARRYFRLLKARQKGTSG